MRRQPVVVSALLLLALGAFVVAGNLTPPPGVVTPTMKTLDEVEPRIAINAANTPGDATNQFRITQPGSYYLTGNITGVAGKSCIRIVAANGVTIDFNGFSIVGVTGSLVGVYTQSDRSTIRNGSIYGFSVGIDAYEAPGVRIQNMTCTNPTNECFKASVGAIIENCFSEYGTVGFDVFESATITNCTSRYAEDYGFEVEDGCTLTNCAAVTAEFGFFVHGPCVLTNCTAQNNQGYGFRVEESSVLTDCTASGNGNAGFSVLARTRLTRCNSRANLYGYYATEANSIVECTASANTSTGITIAGNSNTVERCTIHENTQTGLFVSSGVANNIDGNLLSYNGFNGLAIATADNFAVRNRARGNSNANYSFVAGTEYGLIITNPGAGFSSSAAWANFAY